MKVITIILTTCVLLFLMFSFVSAEINPMRWGEPKRAFFTATIIVGCFMSVFINKAIEDENF